MKAMGSNNFNRYVFAIWALLWLHCFIQYWAFAPPLEVIIASTSLVILAYPFTTYISTTLLRRAMSGGKWGKFTVQFVLLTAAFAIVLYMQMSILAHFERTGFFEGAFLFSDIGGPVKEIINVGFSALTINLGFCGLRFLETTIRLQKELHESQLQTLNGQINPHSMFNILNHIHVLLQKDPQAADELLLQYSDILRYQLYHAHKDAVTVKQDTDHLKEYIEVEKIRWKDKITVDQHWSINDPDAGIPPLLFIPFLENAFKHVARSDSETGQISISFSQSPGSIVFEVGNTKSSIKNPKKEDKGMGLPNIRKRLGILYPDRHQLTITESDGHYHTRLTLEL